MLFSSSKNAEPLPLGWKEYHDPVSGNLYYANKKTKETTWDRPKPDPCRHVKDKSKKVQTSQSAKAGKSSKGDQPADGGQSSNELIELLKTVSFSEEAEVRTYNVNSHPVSPAKKSKKKSLVKSKEPKSSDATVSKFSWQSLQKELKSKADKAINKKSKEETSAEVASSSSPFNLGWKRPSTVSCPIKCEEAQMLTTPTPDKPEPLNQKVTQESSDDVPDKSMPKSASKLSVSTMWKSMTSDIKLMTAELRNEPKDPVAETPTTVSKVTSLPATPIRSTEETLESSQPVAAALPSSPHKSTTITSETETRTSPSKSPSPELSVSVSEPPKSSAISSKALMLATLIKTTPVASSRKSCPGTRKPEKPDSNEETTNERKETSEQAVAIEDDVETKSAQDLSEIPIAPVRSTSVSNRFKAITATMIGSEDFNKQEEDSLNVASFPKSSTRSTQKTPERPLITKKTENDSPASSLLASSIPLEELVCSGEQSVQSAKPIEQSLSKKGTFIKKNRSRESEAIPSAPVVVGLDAARKDKTPKVAEKDTDTIKTESSRGSINQVDLSRSGWVSDNDFGDGTLQQEDKGCGDCGFSQTLHEHLICIGGCIYACIGKPSDNTRMTMEEMGDLFAEEEVSDDESDFE